jgi:TonB family protein
MKVSTWFAAVLACVLTACASGGDAMMSGDRAACLEPGASVAPDVVVHDPDSFRSAMQSLLRVVGAPDTLAAGVWDDDGEPGIRVVDSANVPPPIHEALTRELERSLRLPVDSGGIMLTAYVTAEGDAEIDMRRNVLCRPELINRPELTRALTRAQRRLMVNAQVLLTLWIDETGTPVRVEVGQSSGDDNIDAIAIGVGYVARFLPAMSNGRPLPVRMSWPIVFTH